MATIANLTEDFDGGADGVTVTTLNSVFDAITGNNDGKFSNLHSLGDGVGLAMRVNSVGNFSMYRTNFTGKTLLFFHIYIWLDSTPDSNMAVANWYQGTTKIGDCQIMADRTIRIRDNNTSKWQSSNAIPLDEWVRIDIKVQPGSSTGHQLRYFSGAGLHSTTPTEDSGGVSATVNGATSVDNLRIGVLSVTTVDITLDHLRGDDSTWPAPASVAASNTAPTVNAGADKNVVAYTTETLSPITSDAEGDTVTVTWTQTSGPAVTLTASGNNASYDVPPLMDQTNLVFQATASDGSLSSTDTVIHTVLPHNSWVGPTTNRKPVNEKIRVGGSWV